MVKQTAGRNQLGEFAPKFAELNDDVLFGEVWSREGQLSLKMRSILTISALVSKGLVDSSFQFHIQSAKANGVTKSEMAEILTHLAFYAGWPNAWAAFRVAVEVYKDDAGMDGGLFGIGAPNDAFAQYFVGKSYLKPLTDPQKTVFMANVTFEPGCRNNWHIHHAAKGGAHPPLGQVEDDEAGKDAVACVVEEVGAEKGGGVPGWTLHNKSLLLYASSRGRGRAAKVRFWLNSQSPPLQPCS